MKALIPLMIALLAYNSSFSQQWIDRTYQTNPAIELEYGQALNFNGTSKSLKLDLYTPVCDVATTNAQRPLMIVIHGGSFLTGTKDEQNIVALCQNYAERGYVTASIEYRLGFINDEYEHNCNVFDYYQCFFATDEAEWYRAWYRAVQDAKGALRYLVNRSETYDIDTQNVFVVGESAGAIIAMGVGFMDLPSEKLSMANSLDAVPNPNSNTTSLCVYNVGETFTSSEIVRPDLGTIDGTIELSATDYTIKGIGNMYGAMFQDLLAQHNTNKPKPALYSFHRPCDLVVPADSKKIYYGISWCLSNGPGCANITNTPIVHGSRKIAQWNTVNSYNYNILSEFGSVEFPYSYFGAGGCGDQLPPPFNNNGCHAYDSFNLRETNMASFFAPLVTTTAICEPVLGVNEEILDGIKIFPNPTSGQIFVRTKEPMVYKVFDVNGRAILQGNLKMNDEIDITALESGYYFMSLEGVSTKKIIRLIKN